MTAPPGPSAHRALLGAAHCAAVGVGSAAGTERQRVQGWGARALEGAASAVLGADGVSGAASGARHSTTTKFCVVWALYNPEHSSLKVHVPN